MEPIFETAFSNQSFGFRPNRGCHTALKWMNTNMKDSVWYVEGDIQSYFDTIDHNQLLQLIQRRIKDKTIINLISSGLKAKVFNNDNTWFVPELGTPQGGILSSLLSNIYLHELDKFMEELSREYQGSVNPANRKKNPVSNKLLRAGNKKAYHLLRIPSRIHNEENYRNCKYIRYADDFIIGILGPRKMATEIRDRVNTFLKDELKINLSLEKTKMTHISNSISFLGYLFSRRSLIVKQNYAGNIVKRKMTIPILDVNMSKVIARLKEAKFCDGSGEPVPAFRWLRMPQADTNAKVNQILRGLSQ
jgi:group II intron reverse transcriptase/maturase